MPQHHYKGRHAVYIGMVTPFTSEQPRRLCRNIHSVHFGMATPFGRNLQAESENADAVRQFIWNHYAAFDNHTLAVAVKDIEYYLTSSLFQVSNAEEWRRLQAAFQNELDNRESQKGACP